MLGDSTAAGRGCEAGRGVAVPTAERLAARRRVIMHNLGRSGARAADVLREQVPRAARLAPDVVLISAGANDAMRGTPLRDLRHELDALLAFLLAQPRPPVVVVVSAPEMGSIPRFQQPLRRLIGWRGRLVSRELEAAANRRGAHYAPLDRLVGPRFYRDRSLFAPDCIHPSTRGYELLAATLAPALGAVVERVADSTRTDRRPSPATGHSAALRRMSPGSSPR